MIGVGDAIGFAVIIGLVGAFSGMFAAAYFGYVFAPHAFRTKVRRVAFAISCAILFAILTRASVAMGWYGVSLVGIVMAGLALVRILRSVLRDGPEP